MSKKHIVLHSLAAILVLLFFIVARMPAAVPFAQLQQFRPLVSFGEVSGSIWQGSVGGFGINYNGSNILLGQTRWQIKPWHLLRGQLVLDIQARQEQQTVAGTVALGLDRTLVIRDAEILAPASIINQFYTVPGELEGNVDITITTLGLSADSIKAVDANIVFNNAVYTLAEAVELGTFAARLGMEGDAIKADLTDVDAQVGVSGFATYAPATRQYAVDIKLLPKATANPMIKQSLIPFFGQAADGSFHISHNGQF